jgi:hypothetical protein
MKLPSLRQMVRSALATLRRFPFALLDAAIGSFAAVILAGWSGDKDITWEILNNIFVTCSLGIALFITVVLVGERQKWGAAGMVVLQLLVTLLLGLYWWTLPPNIYGPPEVYANRHLLLLLGVHLLAAFAPFTGKGEVNGFWQFNKSLFLQSLTAALYSGILWAGLSVALAAVDNLFGIKVQPERYLQLFVIIAGIFNTWFFLSGVPHKLEDLELETAYPKGLKVFTQYVLIPLVTVYVLILYAYVIKIMIAWDWPRGWVANLVLGFSITGIFSLLLVFPIRGHVENLWIKRFSRWYYIAEIPLVAVLLLAVLRRVNEYGITENRFFVLVLGVWLAAIVIYFLASRSASIKIIPASLCALIFLGSFGPWGVFSVSEHSQVGRLQAILNSAGILQHGKVVRSLQPVTFEQAQEISSIVRYVCNAHGLASLQPWFDVTLDTLGTKTKSDRASGDREIQPKALADLMGVEYVQAWQAKNEEGFHRFQRKKDPVYSVQGFDHLLRSIVLGQKEPVKKTFTVGTDTLRFALSPRMLELTSLSPDNICDTVTVELDPLVRRLLREFNNPYEIPGDVMMCTGHGRAFEVKMFVQEVVAVVESDSTRVERVNLDVLVARRRTIKVPR